MKAESKLRISADLKYLSTARDFVERTARALGVVPAAVSEMLLAVDEAVTNIVVHGYQGQPGTIEIRVSCADDCLRVCLQDQAEPFDPTTVPPPDVTLPLEERPVGGMGVYLMTHLVDEVIHRVTPQGGNELTLIKKGVG
jgi:serine/threonine-protein kinase RsbW